MLMTPMIRQYEVGAEERRDAVGSVTSDRQPATFLGTVGRECADDDMAADLHGLSDTRDVSRLFFRRVEKMKRCTIVPYFICARWLPRRHIRYDPVHLVACCIQPCPRCYKRRVG